MQDKQETRDRPDSPDVPEAHSARKWRDDDPRRLRMAEKRAAILQAARPILLRDGFGGATLDRVAAEGGIAKMTLYRHFPNKEALFEAMVIATCEGMRVAIENAPRAGLDQSAARRLADELRALILTLVQPEALALYRLVVAEGWRFPELAHAFERSGMRVIRLRIAEILASGGVPAQEHALRAAGAVALTLGDVYQHALLGIVDTPDEAMFEKQIAAAVAYALAP